MFPSDLIIRRKELQISREPKHQILIRLSVHTLKR